MTPFNKCIVLARKTLTLYQEIISRTSVPHNINISIINNFDDTIDLYNKRLYHDDYILIIAYLCIISWSIGEVRHYLIELTIRCNMLKTIIGGRSMKVTGISGSPRKGGNENIKGDQINCR